MTKHFQFFLLLALIASMSGCVAIGDIFKAGMWWGIILVIGVIGIIVWIASRGKKE